ncbi:MULTISPECIES: binary toxin-like calcium binding domain-containing protein [Bacillus cereus group]|uniref:Vip4 n=1 Tax=Bacillus thuringiensis TaxID=1428 RepID=A0A1C4E5K2_BACTU|nr:MULTISPECIES: binary toxin-like calcium binding domain-containing protein [Bacillus cereus group]MED3025703.1 PA14 domain-containing protein [Bacillus wiedmannii]OTY00910.1 Iota toxin protein Ib [Bacillus thuringiensis serovar wratislaviensis]SCC38903.1 Vip4 [Bacillus thuringiensis]
MKLKRIFKCLTITAVLSQIAVYPTSSYAVSDNENKITKEEKKSIQGLVGYYFKDDHFQELDFISLEGQGKLLDKEKINNKSQTIRWMGRIKPSQTGDYIISTSSDKNIILQVNGETIINQENVAKSLKLEKDKIYELKIEYRNITDLSSDLQLLWSIDGNRKEQIPQKNILSPNFSEKESLPDNKRDLLLLPNFNLFDNKIISTELKDTDKDGIPDKWEEQGYTFKNQQIVEWDDSYLVQGYKKYVSNPYKARTAADPYTDFEKVSGHMPEATKDEARDPLIAAYPAVGVGMEKLLFSKNENITEGGSETKSTSVTDTNTNTNSVEIGSTVEATLNPFALAKVTVSAKYGHTWTNSTAIQNSDSQSWSNQIGINTAESAYLNANVRYYNTGTAPIYDLRPTSNFVFQNSGTSIATITAGPNQIGNSLGPGDTYPQKNQAPISLDKANEAGTVKIAINAKQLDALQNRSEILNIETTQNKGQYATLDDTGLPVTDPSKQWDPIRTNIDKVSGSLILNLSTSKESLERRVAARNENDPEDKTPEITIREAIKKAFNAKEKEGRLYYIDDNGKEVILDESAVNLVGDEKTQKEIEKQLDQMQDKKIYNVKWKRGMNITLHTPEMYYDFETSNTGWYYTYQEYGGYTGKKRGRINSGTSGFAEKQLELKPYTTYTARAYVRTATPAGKSNVVFYIDSTVNGNGKGASHKVDIEGDKWQLIEVGFYTGSHPEDFKKLGLKNNGNASLHFDDVSVSEWKNGENLSNNIATEHKVDRWQTGGDSIFPYHYVQKLYFDKIPNVDVEYEVEWLGKPRGVVKGIDDGNKRYIDITEIPIIGNGCSNTDRIVIYAISKKDPGIKVQVAEWDGPAWSHKLKWNIASYPEGLYHNGIFLTKVPNFPLKYQVFTTDQNNKNPRWSGLLPAMPTSLPNETGQWQKGYWIDLAIFDRKGIPKKHNAKVFAVDPNNPDLKVLIASYSKGNNDYFYPFK